MFVFIKLHVNETVLYINASMAWLINRLYV
jgi:hypothetical protein